MIVPYAFDLTVPYLAIKCAIQHRSLFFSVYKRMKEVNGFHMKCIINKTHLEVSDNFWLHYKTYKISKFTEIAKGNKKTNI